MKSFFLLFILISYADLQLSFHGQSGESDRYYRPLVKDFPLTKGKRIHVVSKVNSDHQARNNLNITLHCGPRVPKAIYTNKSFCGLTHLSYNNSNEVLTLHFTSYNPASPEGDCSGSKYTVNVETKEFCRPKEKAPQQLQGPSQDHNTSTDESGAIDH